MKRLEAVGLGVVVSIASAVLAFLTIDSFLRFFFPSSNYSLYSYGVFGFPYAAYFFSFVLNLVLTFIIGMLYIKARKASAEEKSKFWLPFVVVSVALFWAIIFWYLQRLLPCCTPL